MVDIDPYSPEQSVANYWSSSMMLSERNDHFGTGRIVMSGCILIAEILIRILRLLDENLQSKA